MKNRIKYYFLVLSLFFFNITVVFAENEDNGEKLKLNFLYIISVGLHLIKILVPIVLIVMVGIDIFKMTTFKDSSELRHLISISIKRILAAVFIFFLPSLIALLLNIVSIGPNWHTYTSCINNPSDCKVDFTEPEEIKIDVPPSSPETPSTPETPSEPEVPIVEGAPSIVSVEHKAAFVIVTSKKGSNGKDIAGYYFAPDSKTPTGKEDRWVDKKAEKLEIAKIPGTYYVYVKDTDNNISKPEKLVITYEDLYRDGPRSRNKSSNRLSNNLDGFLFGNSDSIENLDDFIAISVKSAGLFTKEGVVTAGISAPNYLLYKYGTNIPYISNIHCFGQRYNVYFGSNPKWGKPITIGDISSAYRDEAREKGIYTFCQGTNGGLDCAAFVGWSIHNGGFKAENTAGSYVGSNKAKQISVCSSYDGKKCKSLKNKNTAFEMYDKAQMGDQISNNSHVMLIIGKYDKGLYVYEGTTPVGMGEYSYDWLYKEGYFKLTQMEEYYASSGNYACNKDSKGNKISIPSSWIDKKDLFRDCKA